MPFNFHECLDFGIGTGSESSRSGDDTTAGSIVFVVVMTGGGRLGNCSEGSGRDLMGSFVVKVSFACFSIDGGELSGVIVVRGEIVPVAGCEFLPE